LIIDICTYKKYFKTLEDRVELAFIFNFY